MVSGTLMFTKLIANMAIRTAYDYQHKREDLIVDRSVERGNGK